MKKDFQGFRHMVAGISGMGKSYLVKKKIIPALAKRKPVVVFDRKEEYSGRAAIDSDKSWKGFDSIYPFLSYLMGTEFLKTGVYVINCRKDDDYIFGLNLFLTARQPVTIILDEAHDIFLDRELYQAKRFLIKMARYGRADGIDLMLISQRFMDVPPDIRSQFLGAISFKQTHPSDVKALDGNGWAGAEKVFDLKEKEYEIYGQIHNSIIQSLK